MKRISITVVFMSILVSGCTSDQNRLRQLQTENESLASRVVLLEREVDRYKNLDTSVFSEIAEPQDDSTAARTAKALDSFLSRFPSSPLVPEAKSRLEKARAILRKQEERQIASDKEKERGSFRSLLDVESDPARYLDKLLRVNATVEISSYYGLMEHMRSTHLAFRISDGTASVLICGARDWDGTEELRQFLLKGGNQRMCVRYVPRLLGSVPLMAVSRWKTFSLS